MESRHLVERATNGDPIAVDELLRLHLPRLRAYVRLRAGPVLLAKESASDIVQSVCRDVIEGIDRFRWGGEAGFRHWLFETALRKLADRHAHWSAKKRDAGREVAPVADDGGDEAHDLLDALGSLTTPSEHVRADEAAQQIERAFRTLPERQQEVITLSRIVGLSHAEIAEVEGLADGATVRRLLHRGLAALSESLINEQRDPGASS